MSAPEQFLDGCERNHSAPPEMTTEKSENETKHADEDYNDGWMVHCYLPYEARECRNVMLKRVSFQRRET